MRLDEAARQYLGVKFLHQGRNPRVGIDCVGLIVCATWACGIRHPSQHDYPRYHRHPAHGILEERMRAAFGPPHDGPLRSGDMVTVEYHGRTRHVGIIGEQDGVLTIIHTNSTLGRVTECSIDDKIRSRITGIYRVSA